MKSQYALNSQKARFIGHQRGASLLEGIAYLGIAAIVILGAVSLLTGAFSSAQTNRSAEEVVSIRTGVKKLYMGQSAAYGTESMNGNLIAAGVFPSTLSLNKTSNSVLNTWNGSVDVIGGSNTFTIAYDSVPQDVCINMVSGGTGWTQVEVNGANPILAFPATPSAASTACSQAANKIVWTAL